MTAPDPAPLPGLDLDLDESSARARPLVRCRACGRPLRDRDARTWGLGAGCRHKLAVRTAPRPSAREVEQETLPGVWHSYTPYGGRMETVAEVDAFASAAHAGQVDKIGVPYLEHVRAVAAGLAPFGPDLHMAGLLHDVLEDTDWTAERLRAAGIPDRVVGVVEIVTNQPGVPYGEKIRRIAGSREATLVKIADNAHNSHPDRAARLPGDARARLAAKYRAARDVLWAAADAEDIERIISIVNPHLLPELRQRTAADADSPA